VRRWWLALVGAVVVLGSLSPRALAAAPSCASAPPAYTGSDQTVAALTQLNIDEDSNCQALAARLDQSESDLSSFSTQAHSDSGSIDSHVQAVNSTLSGWTSTSPLSVQLPSGGSGQAVAVTNWPADQTVGLDSSSSGQFDGIGQSEHGDLWVLIGVIVGCFALDVFLRKVWP
jgi:hypothetical protein